MNNQEQLELRKELKEILIMFKTEQDYAERKNQITLLFLGILATFIAAIFNKIPTPVSWILVGLFSITLYTTLASFFLRGTILRFCTTKLFKIVKFVFIRIKLLKTFFTANNNYWDSNDWIIEQLKNNEKNALNATINKLKLEVNDSNKQICDQIWRTAIRTYSKLLYFKYSCITIIVLGIAAIITYIAIY